MTQGEQQQQQRPKQIPGESKFAPCIREDDKRTRLPSASYARIAKSNPSSGTAPTGSNPAPVSTASVPPPNPTRPTNPPARPSGNNYQQQNQRPQQWTDNSQQENRANVGPPAPPNEQQVFVGSLPPEFTRETLINCFSQFGRVSDAKIHAPARDNKKVCLSTSLARHSLLAVELRFRCVRRRDYRRFGGQNGTRDLRGGASQR